MRVLRPFAAILVAILTVIPWHISEAQTLDFTSVNLPPGGCTDASAYLASFGITFVPVSSGATAQICNATGSSIFPTSSPNFFFIGPAVTNTNVSGDLVFSTPVGQISFVTTAVSPATSVPAWDAEAYDASNTLLSSVGEPSLYPGPGALSFTLPGPGITRFHFDAFNSAARTFNAPPIDHITLGCQAQVPSSWGQSDPPWGPVTYDSYDVALCQSQPPTKGECIKPTASRPRASICCRMQNLGCTTTNLSMALDAAGVTMLPDPISGLTSGLDPGSFNSFMNLHSDYFAGGVLIEKATLDANFFTLGLRGNKYIHFDDTLRNDPSLTSLKNAVCNGTPVIVGVQPVSQCEVKPGLPGEHYVVVTGEHDDSIGKPHFDIVDPGCTKGNSALGLPPIKSLDAYNNNFVIRGFVSDPTDVSTLEVATDDNADLLITDASGNQTGFDPASSTVLQQIPGSSYGQDFTTDNETGEINGVIHSINIFHPAQGLFQVTVVGLGVNTYTLLISPYATDGTSLLGASLNGIAGIGSVSSFQVQYSPTPGSTPVISQIATFQSTLADITNSLALGLIDNAGIANALSSKINAASAAAAKGDYNTAMNNLNAFINQVNAQTGKHITGITPQVLLSDANSLIAQMP